MTELSKNAPDTPQIDGALLRQRTRTLLKAASDRAKQQFRNAVRPIYMASDKDAPEQLGSAVLIKIDDDSCLLTAAHVIDKNKLSSLYVGGDNELIMIVAEFIATVAPSGDRDNDHYDFAIAKLTPEMLEKMGSLKFIEEHDIAPPASRSNKILYTALGYPNSRNKLDKMFKRKVRSELYTYSNVERFNPALARWKNLSGDESLFIEYRKHSRNDSGHKVFSVKPRGLSGGALIHAADFSDRDVLLGEKPPVPKFAGIIIEHYKSHQTLLGTRIDAIIHSWRNGAKTIL